MNESAAPSLGANSKAPVEITADDAIEWLRNENLYRVRGNAMAKQGDTTIKADVLEAAYDPALGEQNIQTITAIGHVDVVNADRTITAEKGVYHVPTGQLTLSGSNLRITSPTMHVTADQSLTYDRTQNKATARGNAIVKTEERTLKADQIDAWFDGKNNLSRATARGRVTIQTAQEILEADSADYNTVTQQAVATGNVSLTRGQNHLQGARAVVNLKTGVSQLFGTGAADSAQTAATPGSSGRVRAIFFPGSDKNLMPGQTTEQFVPMRPRPINPRPTQAGAKS